MSTGSRQPGHAAGRRALTGNGARRAAGTVERCEAIAATRPPQ